MNPLAFQNALVATAIGKKSHYQSPRKHSNLVPGPDAHANIAFHSRSAL
jgi:hypothetical protein